MSVVVSSAGYRRQIYTRLRQSVHDFPWCTQECIRYRSHILKSVSVQTPPFSCVPSCKSNKTCLSMSRDIGMRPHGVGIAALYASWFVAFLGKTFPKMRLIEPPPKHYGIQVQQPRRLHAKNICRISKCFPLTTFVRTKFSPPVV